MTGQPYSQDEIRDALGAMRVRAPAFFAALSPGEFTRGTAERWSPAHHLHHLILSNKPVAYALTLPRDRLPLRPGDLPSREYMQVRDLYREALATGVRASGRYLPDPHGTQDALVAEYSGTLELLEHNLLMYWTDAELDAHTLVHPVLGPLSVREMLFFTLYHNEHHLRGVQASLNRTENP